jgi:serine/threonine protein kinase
MSWNPGHLLKSGQYEVVRLLGSGGFGMTYLAKDLHLERQVVIKRPNLSFEADRDYDKFLRRFKREGQVLAQVQISHIVRVIEFTEIDGMPCLVMDFVAGETLNECILRRGSIPEAEVWQLFNKLAAALHALHEQGIIHCDIHPGNIIVQPNGEPMLIDFGSTKLLHPTTWTVTTTVNKDFSPYEQMAGPDENNLSAQTAWDIYSLAANMFFAVTGEKPLPANSRKMFGDSLKAPKRLKPDLSRRLNEIIMKGLSLEKSDRPKSIKEWKDSLDNKRLKSIRTLFAQSKGLFLVALAYLLSSVPVGVYVIARDSYSTIPVFVCIGGAIGSSIIASDIVENRFDSQKLSITISITANLSFAYTLGGVLASVSIGALVGAIFFAFTKYPSKKYSLIRLAIFIFTGALLIGGVSGYLMKGTIQQILSYSVFTSFNLFLMVTGYHFSRISISRSRRTMSIFVDYMVSSLLSILVGVLFGILLRFSVVKYLVFS